MASAIFIPCSPDPLRHGDADAVRMVLLRRMAGFRAVGQGPWRGLAARLLRILSPVLVWMRDHAGLVLDHTAVRFSMELSSVAALATRRRFRRLIGGEIVEIEARAMPEAIVYPLNRWLDDLPGYDSRLPVERQTVVPLRHHANVVFFGAPA